MNEEHVITSYQAWEEKRLDKEERRVIQLHLQDCESCRDYFEKMSTLLDTTDPSLLPRLEADPFLPTRIRAIVDSGVTATSFARAAAWLRVSFVGVMAVIAVAAGVYLGKGLATTESANGDAAIVTAYYEAVAQTEFAGAWGDVIEEKEEEQR
jgi:predicted anti-sigma-YlaC factor YlaD